MVPVIQGIREACGLRFVFLSNFSSFLLVQAGLDVTISIDTRKVCDIVWSSLGSPDASSREADVAKAAIEAGAASHSVRVRRPRTACQHVGMFFFFFFFSILF